MGLGILDVIIWALSLVGALGLAFAAVYVLRTAWNVLKWNDGSPRASLYTRLWDTLWLVLIALVPGAISTVLLLLALGML